MDFSAAMRFVVNFLVVILVATTIACGGGGSGNSSQSNQAPVASVEADFFAPKLTLVFIDGSASSDADGSITSYSWTQTGGPDVVLANADSAEASFNAPDVNVDTQLTFQLRVTDDQGASDSDTLIVTILSGLPPQGVSLSGLLTFDLISHNGAALDYNNIQQSAIRGATVELLNAADSSILQTTTSDENGGYSFQINNAGNYLVRVKAELIQQDVTPSWDFTVVDNTNEQALYVMDSDVQPVGSSSVILNLNAPSGWTGSSYGDPRVAAPFAILDFVYQAKQKIIAVEPNIVMPNLLLNWSVDNVPTSGDLAVGQIGTSFFRTDNQIYLLGAENVDTEEYDKQVVIHEWGHYFEHNFSRSDSLGGSHSGNDRLDIRVAFGEGFATALAAMLLDDPVYRDSSGNAQSRGFTFNIENNPITNRGWYSEASVQSIIYDLYDDNNEGVDSLSLGLDPLYQVLINQQKDTLAFVSIFSFVDALKDDSPGDVLAIDALLTSQNIVVDDEYGSNQTNNGGDARNLPVYMQITPDGTSIEVCSYTSNGRYNKLGNRKFVRLPITTAGNYQFVAEGATGDVDFAVYSQGERRFISEQEVEGRESTVRFLTARDYIIDIYDYAAVNTDDNSSVDRCFDLSVSPN